MDCGASFQGKTRKKCIYHAGFKSSIREFLGKTNEVKQMNEADKVR